MNAWGALSGLCVALGSTSVLLYDGPWRARQFYARVHAILHPRSGRSAIRSFLHRHAGTQADRIEQRQRRAGINADAAAHFLQCAVGAAVGLAIGTALIAVLTQLQQVRRPAALIVLLAVTVASGWLVVDHRLSRSVAKRQAAASIALPSFVESLALAVTAGASLPHALEIVVTRSDDVLAEQIAATASPIHVDTALTALRDGLPQPAVARLADAIDIALERGTPIADVLHAQAIDAREESRRLLLERAGRREVGMLIPVIFFVLPAVVIVALYPGFRELSSIAT